MELMKRLINDEEGQGLVEYALITGLVALVAVGAVTLAGQSVNTIWTSVKNKLSSVPITT